MNKAASAIFKTFFLSLCIVANTHFAYAQTASILPQGYTQYLDSNGKPLSAGKVYNYIPNTLTPKTTWQDAGETIVNANPVVLDAGGRAKILGDGNYRQRVFDRNNVLIWDAVTSSTGSGSSSSTATGDGDLVGTIKPWAGMTAPNQYMFTYGQEVSRTTYSALYAAITSSQVVFCNSGSPTLSGLSNTTNFWIGMSVEVSCVAAGFSTVISKTSSSVTLAANANVSTNTTAIFYPWGRGDGSSTFNLPDFRGVALVGNNIMGGVASSNLTTTYFGATNPNSVGALGGSESFTLIDGNVPSRNSGGTIAVTGGVNTGTNTYRPSASNQVAIYAFNGSAASAVSPGAGLNIYPTSQQASADTATFTFSGITQGGGIAASATVAAAGSGYTNGSQTITVAGGTCTTQPQFTVTVSGNAFTGTPVLLTAGSCTVAPANPAATTGGGGTGGTLTVTYTGSPVSVIQPSRTSNYIIKVTPDTNSATASGVTSLGGMTGDIACGSGLLCTGNNISVTSSGSSSLVVGTTTIASGTTSRILYDDGGILGEYTISGSGTVVAMANSPVLTTPNIGAATGTSVVLSGAATAGTFIPTSSSAPTDGMYLSAASTLGWSVGSTAEMQLTSTALSPATDGGLSLGTTVLGWQNLFGNTGFVLNIEAGNWVATHTSGILTVGTGDLRVTTAGTNTASVVTVGGTQTLTGKTISGASNTLSNIANASLTNSSTTVNGQTCTLGASCTVTASASAITVGTTTVGGGTTTRILFNNAGTLGEYTISGTGSVAMTTSPTFVTPTLGAASATTLVTSGAISPGNLSNFYLSTSGGFGVVNWDANDYTIYDRTNNLLQSYISSTLIQQISSAGEAITGTSTVTSASAKALTVGRLGATTPAFTVDASAATQVAGLSVAGAATGGTVGIAVTDSGANANLSINAKGSGTISIGNTSTGAITLTRATTLSAALTYGGVTLSNSVTGTGSMVLSTSPALTTPNLGTPSAVTLTNATGLPISGITGLGTNVATGLATATGAANGFARVIATGTSALGTSAIAASACASVVTTAATGTATTDVIEAGFNGDPTAVTGYTAGAMLSIIPYPSANNVNFKVCNNTTGSITPGAITLNWRVVR